MSSAVSDRNYYLLVRVAGKDGTLRKDLAGIHDDGKNIFVSSWIRPLVNNDAVVNLPQLSVKSCVGGPLSLEEISTATVSVPWRKAKLLALMVSMAEVYKAASPALIEKQHVCFAQIWEEEVIHSNFQDALIVSIFKKGDKTNCGNYPCFLLLGRSLLASLHAASSHCLRGPSRISMWFQTSARDCWHDFLSMTDSGKVQRTDLYYGFHWSDQSNWLHSSASTVESAF